MMFVISDGIISALIFMFKSEEAQRRWSEYFYPSKAMNLADFAVAPVLDDVRSDFEEDDFETTDFTRSDLSNSVKPSDVSGSVSIISMSSVVASTEMTDMASSVDNKSPMHGNGTTVSSSGTRTVTGSSNHGSNC